MRALSRGRRVVIVGATSAIARAFTRRCAARGDALALVGRDEDELDRCAADARAAGAALAEVVALDAADPAAIDALPERVREVLLGEGDGLLDGVAVFLGAMFDQADAEAEATAGLAKARTMAEINYLAPMHITQGLLPTLRAPGGFVMHVGSVAGDRGRGSNFFYGSTKAAIDAYLEGLRAQQFKRGVAVVTVKPGGSTGCSWSPRPTRWRATSSGRSIVGGR
jgi:short-subunit dehydrogenase